MTTWIIALNGQAVRTIRAEDFGPSWKANGIEVLTYPAMRKTEVCGSGWTGDRCTKLEGHAGRHSNDGPEDQAHRARRVQ